MENKPWYDAQNFVDLIMLNKKFLRREIETAPYSSGLDEETDELVPALLRLNDLGMMTITSQPFEDYFLEDIKSNVRSKRFFGCRQKPFVEFIMEEEAGASRLLQKLQERSYIKIFAFKLNPYEVVKPVDDYCVTIHRWAKTIDELEDASWGKSTWFRVSGEDEDEVFQLKALKTIRPWVIGVAAAVDFGRNIKVLELLEEAAREIGLSPRF
jgi:hypothetical protein